MSSQAIYRTYRPTTFAEVTDQNHVKVTLKNQIVSGTVSHAYLFAGPRGVGKTTLARLLAKSLNCSNRKEDESEPCNTCDACQELSSGSMLDVVEIDAASNTGVDHVRENIIESVRFHPSRGKYKIFIIDEVHMLSGSAFNALLKTLEEPPAHVVFVLATTEIHKIPQTILSRCQRFDFKRIATPDLVARLKMITAAEQVEVSEDVLASIARQSEGCLRDAESLLGQVLALGEKNITMEEASLILPITNTETVVAIVESVSRSDVQKALSAVNQFVDQGGSVKHLVNEIIDFVRDVLFTQLGKIANEDYGPSITEEIEKINSRLSVRELTDFLDALLHVSAKPMHEAFPQLPLEIALVGQCKDARIEEEQEAPLFEQPVPENKVEQTVEPVTSTKEPEPEAVPLHEVSDEGQNKEGNSSNEKKVFEIDDLKNKWKRCCEAASKRNIALPLVLQHAIPQSLNGKELIIGLKHAFHYNTLKEKKNADVVAEAVNEVMQSDIHVKAVYLEAEKEKSLDELAQAFGGNVVD